MGKHNEESKNEQILKLRNELKKASDLDELRKKEIENIKQECANQFNRISKLATSNLCGQTPGQRLNRINEIAQANFLALVEDFSQANFLTLVEDFSIGNDADKIIELPANNQIRSNSIR